MSPFEHGEVFVLDDGGEVDLDLGNYERFVDITLTCNNNITTGKIYRSVIEKERKGHYLGKTVQVVPHVCNEIQNWVEKVARVSVDNKEGPADFCVIELGGTVGDIESGPFIEALRQFQFRVGVNNFCNIHVTFVPMLGVVGEQKTKPTQQSVRTLRSLGLAPDVIICRSASPLTKSTKSKIASFCHVAPDAVVGIHDVSNLYRVPLMLEQQNLPTLLLSRFQLLKSGEEPKPNLASWKELAEMAESCTSAPEVKIALVGKYTGLSDSYLSVIKALQHSCIELRLKLKILWITASSLEPQNGKSEVKACDNAPATTDAEAEENEDKEEQDEEEKKEQTYEEAWALLKEADGILVPGGFGDRGIEGKILAANYARVNKIPYLGVCLGMQLAVIEVARNVLGRTEATSEEFDAKTQHPAIVFMPEISKTHMGGTMRLGKRTTIINSPDSLASIVYRGASGVDERHRHRYEVNPAWVNDLETQGKLRFVGKDETGQRMEIAELPTDIHPFFLGTQYHPEFLSRPRKPSPPFLGFVAASADRFKSHYNLQ
eukprot:TRINITY_DN12596_c0_g1_i1.p1 TRINITY_DN12596_c0_g1~~TRINITY_DN12596_c0_g1_i1.p1  ORF type:complete len:600 (-),score=182.33 TRINITY_DN12596_c0_g1_i1:143-1780(-)